LAACLVVLGQPAVAKDRAGRGTPSLHLGAALDLRSYQGTESGERANGHGGSAFVSLDHGSLSLRTGGRLVDVPRRIAGYAPVLSHREYGVSALVVEESGTSAYGLGLVYMEQTIFPLRFIGALPAAYFRVGRSEAEALNTEVTFGDFGSFGSAGGNLRLAVSVPVGDHLRLSVGAVAELTPLLATDLVLEYLTESGGASSFRLLTSYPDPESYGGYSAGASGVFYCPACNGLL
jgi:hypothetical protein